MCSYAVIRIGLSLLFRFEDRPYNEVGVLLGGCIAITISTSDPLSIKQVSDAIIRALNVTPSTYDFAAMIAIPNIMKPLAEYHSSPQLQQVRHLVAQPTRQLRQL